MSVSRFYERQEIDLIIRNEGALGAFCTVVLQLVVMDGNLCVGKCSSLIDYVSLSEQTSACAEVMG